MKRLFSKLLLVTLVVIALSAIGASVHAIPSGAASTQAGPAVVCATADINPDLPELECYYPSVQANASPATVLVGQSSRIYYYITGADPAKGCYMTSPVFGRQTIPVDANGYANSSVAVGPFGTTGTFGFDIICDAYPNPGTAHTEVSVTDYDHGGPNCTENSRSQMFATFISMTGIPTVNGQFSVVAEQLFTVKITFRNDGACTWTFANNYVAGSQNRENNNTWGTSRLYLAGSDSIAPGQTKEFTLNAVAPSIAGSYGFGWRMLRDGINWFGDPSNGSFVTINVTRTFPPPAAPTAKITPAKKGLWSGSSVTLNWSCTDSTAATASGSWSGSKPTTGSQVIGPLSAGNYTYTIKCTRGGSSATDSALVGVIDEEPLAIRQTQVYDRSLSFDAVTGIKCKSHYGDNEGYNTVTGQLKIRVWQNVKYCFNINTHLLACGAVPCPIYRTMDHSDPGFPWAWDDWSYGSCSTNTCSDYRGVGTSFAKIWMKGNIHSCLNVPFVGQVLCKNKHLTVGTIVYGTGQTPYDWVDGP